MNKNFVVVFLSISFFYVAKGQQNCLFKNPLCFYNTDVLTYLQVLHKNQQYESMLPFLKGSFIQKKTNKEIIDLLSQEDFGYQMKKSGIKTLEKNRWSLTYQRNIMGTNENFKIECRLINDTCRVWLDDTLWKRIFNKEKE
jgi:hypothetical protein